MKTRISPSFLALLFIVTLTFLVYQPGLYGDYEFDDLANITQNEALTGLSDFSWRGLYDAALSGNSGPMKRPVSMGSFALNAATTGLSQPLYFKLTNLLVHLVNGILVYWLIGLVLRRLYEAKGKLADQRTLQWVQCSTTAIWLLHPLNLTSVLYIVQRMTSLAAGFTFLATGLYILGRQRLLQESGRNGWSLILCGVLGAGTLAILSKETGALVPPLLLVIEITLFKFACAEERDKRWLTIIFLVAVLLPLLLFMWATATNSPYLYGGYVSRDFDMTERVLTQARVLWFYLQLICVPSLTSLGLYHDDFVMSRALLAPPQTLVAIVGLGFLLAIAVASIRKLPVLAFGVFWFFTGHLIESTTIPLEMVHEHRNYLPCLGPIFTVAYYGCIVGVSPDSVKWRRGAIVLMALLFAVITWLRSEQWGNILTHTVQEVTNHPKSERANQQLGRIYFMLYADDPKQKYFDEAKVAFERARRSRSINSLAHVSLLQLAMKAQQPVDQELLTELNARLENLPLPPVTIPALRGLLDCQIFAYCNLPDAQIVKLLDAAIRNPHRNVGIKIALQLYLAQYYVDKVGDLNAGTRVIESAILENPKNFDLHLNMARVYRVAAKFDLAAIHLAEAKRLDELQARQNDLRQEEGKLQRDLELNQR